MRTVNVGDIVSYTLVGQPVTRVITASNVEAFRTFIALGGDVSIATPSVTPVRAVHSLDYPALDGRVVTQAHADYCQANGHATYKRDGVDTGMCPRCGEMRQPSWQAIAEVSYATRARQTWADARGYDRRYPNGDTTPTPAGWGTTPADGWTTPPPVV